MPNSDIFDDLSRNLIQQARITKEKNFRSNIKNRIVVEIPKYDTFNSDNIYLDADEEIITDCKGKCVLLNTSMFIDNWIYINEDGFSYVYLNILCEYANLNNINTIVIPDFIDVIIVNSGLNIEYSGKIIFNENLKAISSYYEPVDKNNIIVSINNIYFRSVENISIYSLDFSKCKNISMLVSGSFFNINIRDLIFSSYLLLIKSNSFNKKVNNITLSDGITIEPSVMMYINKCNGIRAAKISKDNLGIILSLERHYITNKLILDTDMFLFLCKNSYSISYKNFNTLYIQMSPTKFMNECDIFIKELISYANDYDILNMEVYKNLGDKELEDELINIFKTLFTDNYRGNLFITLNSDIIIKCLEQSHISFFDYVYYCSALINMSSLYKEFLLYIYKIVSDSYKTVNIVFYNSDIGNEIDDIVNREYVLSKICSKNNKLKSKYNFSVDKTLIKLVGE